MAMVVLVDQKTSSKPHAQVGCQLANHTKGLLLSLSCVPPMPPGFFWGGGAEMPCQLLRHL